MVYPDNIKPAGKTKANTKLATLLNQNSGEFLNSFANHDKYRSPVELLSSQTSNIMLENTTQRHNTYQIKSMQNEIH